MKNKLDSCLAQLLFSHNASWRRDSAVGIVRVCGAGVVGSTPTASTKQGEYCQRTLITTQKKTTETQKGSS